MTLRDMEKAATPGPWEANHRYSNWESDCTGFHTVEHDGEILFDTDDAEAADFIAAARNDLPEMLDLLEQAVCPNINAVGIHEFHDPKTCQWCADRARITGETG